MATSDPVQIAGMTEREKMVAGLPYDAFDPQLWEDRVTCRRLLRRLNTQIDYDDAKSKTMVLTQLLGSLNTEDPPFIEPPFYCDYGFNIKVGKNFYTNFNCVILDCCSVTIGDRVLFGPNVQIYTVGHELDPVARNGTRGPETATPVKIEDDVWVGGSAIIMPGEEIEERSNR